MPVRPSCLVVGPHPGAEAGEAAAVLLLISDLTSDLLTNEVWKSVRPSQDFFEDRRKRWIETIRHQRLRAEPRAAVPLSSSPRRVRVDGQ
jgi:hypothetical protein